MMTTQSMSSAEDLPLPDPEAALRLALVEVAYARQAAGLPPVGAQPQPQRFALRDLSPFGR
jgi:hypothetical protein